ncbi:MAG: glycoside hydrolase family 2, partial [Ignavibacteriae bacterium]|nr:glycoside hydrolase family 2 [Ignavibacteriota bacterium]
FQINQKNATGIIQWMLNSAWPEMYWQLYDTFLMPNGAYFGAKKANQSIQLIYNYGDNSIYINNNSLSGYENLVAAVKIFDINSNLIYNELINLKIESESSKLILAIPENLNFSPNYFLDLTLIQNSEKEIARNFYWLSTKEDILDYEAEVEGWPYYTPSKQYSDFTALKNLPNVELKVSTVVNFENNQIQIDIENKNDSIAFFVELLFFEKDSEDVILPVFWSDNYISILPNELRKITATFKNSEKLKNAELRLKGWNLKN